MKQTFSITSQSNPRPLIAPIKFSARSRLPPRRHRGAVEIRPQADAVPLRCPHRNASAAAARAWRGHPGWLVGPGGACEAVPFRSWRGIVARGAARQASDRFARSAAAKTAPCPSRPVRSALHPDPRGQTSRRSQLGPRDQKRRPTPPGMPGGHAGATFRSPRLHFVWPLFRDQRRVVEARGVVIQVGRSPDVRAPGSLEIFARTPLLLALLLLRDPG